LSNQGATIEAGAKVNHLSYVGDAMSAQRQSRAGPSLQLRRLLQAQDTSARAFVAPILAGGA